MILDKLENLANNEEKKEKFNKLCEKMTIEKEKELDDIIKDKEKQIISTDFIKSKTISKDLKDESLGIMVQNCADTLFELNHENSQEDNEIVKIIVDTVKDLNENNQKFIINNLNEKADNEEKKKTMKKLTTLIDKLAKLKRLVNLVRQKHLNKMVKEKIKDVNKYGIVILPNEEKEDKSKTLIMNKPKELSENEFNHMLSIFKEDLKKINEDNYTTLSSIDKYLKDKECEKKLKKLQKL